MPSVILRVVTTESVPNRTIESVVGPVAVINNKIYGEEVFHRQPDDTFDLLRQRLPAMGANTAVGARLVPMLDARGVQVMMAYGTAVVLE